MAKKSTPVEKAARMLDLVPFINAHQGISIADLASAFGITEEELLTDLNSLWMCGDTRFDLIELDFDSGYVTIRNSQTLNLVRSLSQQEIISILIGLDLLEKNFSPQREDLAKEISLLRSKLGKGLTRILDATPALDGQIVATIQEAMQQRSKMHISYFSPIEDEVTERDITPLDLYRRDGQDFLIAFCERAEAQRTFRVNRIQSALILDSQAKSISLLRDEADLVKTSLTIHRHLRKSRESLGSYLSGEGAQVVVSSFNLAWISRTVISAAGAMEVTSSEKVRSQIREQAAQTLAQYR